MILAGVIWSIYGVYDDQTFPVTTTNAPLAFLGAYYAYVYLSHAPRHDGTRRRAIGQLVVAVGFVTAVGVVAGLKQGDDSVDEVLGMLGCAASVALYAAPIISLPRLIVTRSVEHVCVPLTASIVATTVAWSVYAALADDVWILATNLVGVALGVLQIAAVIYVMCAPRTAAAAAAAVCETAELNSTGLFDALTPAGGDMSKGHLGEEWSLLPAELACGTYGTGGIELEPEHGTAPVSNEPSPPPQTRTASPSPVLQRLWPRGANVEGGEEERDAVLQGGGRAIIV